MTNESKPVTVQIMDKEYILACPDEEREPLIAAVEFLNRRMRELRESGKVIGNERIAVMAALNIAHEFLDYKRRSDSFSGDVNAALHRIQSKLSGALSRRRTIELSSVS
ncbi:MAG: cell division protein ZapA [Gammaproteobacteria bacterium]|nr:cell division protein ZapA [Gammaproteobacteria bacterium]